MLPGPLDQLFELSETSNKSQSSVWSWPVAGGWDGVADNHPHTEQLERRLSPTVPKSSEEEAPEGQGQALQRFPGECGPSAGQSQETCTPNPRIWPCEAG